MPWIVAILSAALVGLKTHGIATNKTECNILYIMYNAPLAHQDPSILQFFMVQMTGRRYRLSLLARRCFEIVGF